MSRCCSLRSPVALAVIFTALSASSTYLAVSALKCNATVDGQSALARWTSLSQLTFSRDSHAAAAFANRLWVVGGIAPAYYTQRLEHTTTRSDVVSSYDGVTWTEELEEAPFRRRFGHALLPFTDPSDGIERLLLVGGFTPEPSADMWLSADGTQWTEVNSALVPWSGRGFHCSLVFDGRLFVVGGSPLNNEVWAASSALLGDWTQLPDAPWSPRAAHGCAAHEVVANATLGDASRSSYLFVMGGWRDESLNDVWRMSTTGEWELLVESAPWTPRGWFSLISFDSRNPGDVSLGNRLWVFGGGVVGAGVAKMHPFSDVWYSRNGSDWIEASSDTSGVSTAEWGMVTQQNREVCTGKWGHVVVAFHRNVSVVYYCGATCMDTTNSTRLAGQLISVCDPTSEVPPDPTLTTVMKNNAVQMVTLYPDGCGLCSATARYVNASSVPVLVLVAGNVGTQKVNEVFRSNDAMLCESEGVICSGVGVCTLGGGCLCDSGKTGAFCESDLDYTIIDDSSCFPESARVVTSNGAKSIVSVRIGDAVLALDDYGDLVFSTVYYLPHDSHRDALAAFVQIEYESINESGPQSARRRLELTPGHLVFVCDGACTLTDLPQVPARAIKVNNTILVLDSQGESLVPARVTNLATVSRHGALTLYTMTGSIVVDGVLCSNFGDMYPLLPGHLARRRDLVAWWLFAPHRQLFRMLPFAHTANAMRYVMDALVLPVLRSLQWTTSPRRRLPPVRIESHDSIT